MQTIAEMQAELLVGRLKDDDELIERIFPSRPMGLEEAARWMGLSKSTLYHKAGEIVHAKIGKRLLFTRRNLKAWLDANHEAYDMDRESKRNR